MWARVLVGVAGLTGCLIVPKTVSTPQHVRDETSNVVPPAAAMGLDVTTAGGTISVRASQPRVCRRETWAIVDVRHEQTADLEVADGGGGSADVFVLLAIVAAPVTLAVSGLITAVVLAGDKPTLTRERHKVGAVPYECPVLSGNVSVTLVFPSGMTTELVTNLDGVATFAIPVDEPAAGIIEVRANALGPREVRYDRAQPQPAQPAQPVQPAR